MILYHIIFNKEENMGNCLDAYEEWDLNIIFHDFDRCKLSRAQTLKKLEEHMLSNNYCHYYLSDPYLIEEGYEPSENNITEAKKNAEMMLKAHLLKSPTKKFKQINIREDVYRSIKELSIKRKMPLAGIVEYLLDRGTEYDKLKKEKDEFFHKRYRPLYNFVQFKLKCDDKQVRDFFKSDDWVAYEKSLKINGE